MMSATERYFQAVSKVLETIATREQESIGQAAELLAGQIEQGNLIHVAGTGGHSYLGAEDMTWRAGGLVPVDPIFDPGISLSFGARRSTFVERVPGYMVAVLKAHDLAPGEVMIVINAYGINSATIDTALESKRLGLKVIAVTGTEHPKAAAPDHPSRHPTGKNLYELADVFVNTHVPLGDGVVEIENFGQKVAPVSTIANSFALNSIVAETVELLVQRGIEPPIWKSANTPGGDEHNKEYIEKYRKVVKSL